MRGIELLEHFEWFNELSLFTFEKNKKPAPSDFDNIPISETAVCATTLVQATEIRFFLLNFSAISSVSKTCHQLKVKVQVAKILNKTPEIAE